MLEIGLLCWRFDWTIRILLHIKIVPDPDFINDLLLQNLSFCYTGFYFLFFVFLFCFWNIYLYDRDFLNLKIHCIPRKLVVRSLRENFIRSKSTSAK